MADKNCLQYFQREIFATNSHVCKDTRCKEFVNFVHHILLTCVNSQPTQSTYLTQSPVAADIKRQKGTCSPDHQDEHMMLTIALGHTPSL